MQQNVSVEVIDDGGTHFRSKHLSCIDCEIIVTLSPAPIANSVTWWHWSILITNLVGFLGGAAASCAALKKLVSLGETAASLKGTLGSKSWNAETSKNCAACMGGPWTMRRGQCAVPGSTGVQV